MKKRKALTLIEVILSLAVLSLIAVVVLSVFGFSINNIKKSGDRTADILELENQVNININESPKEGEDGITVNIPGLGERTVKGKFITIEEKGKKITTFIPNKN